MLFFFCGGRKTGEPEERPLEQSKIEHHVLIKENLHYQVISGLKQRIRKKLEASTDISHRYLL